MTKLIKIIKAKFLIAKSEFKILLKSPKTFLFRWFCCIIPREYLKIKKDVSIKYMWHKITIPNNHFVQCVLMETFMYKLFSEMKWLNRVLDLWWFIGESAIYLSWYNKEVYVYEMSPKNFSYLVKNCQWIKNISFFNWCISNQKTDYIKFTETWEVSSINRTNQTKWKIYKIKNYNIIDLLKKHNFDWLKIEIEWWEYDIIKIIILN